MRRLFPYLKSWEFVVSMVMALFIFIYGDMSVFNRMEIVETITTIIGILFGVTILGVTVLLSSPSDEYIKFIETKNNAFSTTIEVFFSAFIVYFLCIISLLYVMLAGMNGHRIVYLFVVFIVIYSLLYTVELLRHLKAFIRGRLIFNNEMKK